MTLTIVGHGYVGLVTAVVFADLGNTVYVIGRTADKIKRLARGDPIIYEPGLAEMLKRNLDAGRIHFTLHYNEAIPKSDIVFIAVGTPPKNNGEADLSSVLNVAEMIGKHIRKYIVVACKSTVPVGTNRKIKQIISDKAKVPSTKFSIASCPEFLREGTGISDTLEPDRVVIGTEEARARKLLVEFHKPIGGVRVLTGIESAEMIKYASNSLLATKISFANMIAQLCDKVGADIEEVLNGVGLDNRIGRRFLYPGAGYGGSCFPKDVKALIKIGENYGENMDLLTAVERINDRAIKHLTEKILARLPKSQTGEGQTVALLGLSFKPDTDDMREAPSLKIIERLKRARTKLTVQVYDPIVKQLPIKELKNMIYSENSYQAVTGADVAVIITEWNEFLHLDLVKVAKLMKKPVLVDGRNIYDPEKVKQLGFSYVGVGRI
ncbi:UDP-glucose/GDP-mannose dehydrogenase family protein [Candidatus Roizmanbacteria bacterium]|nr:UDP-glucose/GDP-mannose dehydrogenase family protein [Candidatus Roizmanbacteria bacterium]